MTRSYQELRTVSAAIVAVALLIVLSVAIPSAFAQFIGLGFVDQTGHYFLAVDISPTGEFSILRLGAWLEPVVLCSGVGARVSNGGLVLAIQSSYSGFGSAGYVRCQAGIYMSVRASGMMAGIVTVMLSGPTSVGYPAIMVLSMTRMVGELT